MPDFTLDVLRQVSLAGGVLDQDHLADTDNPEKRRGEVMAGFIDGISGLGPAPNRPIKWTL
jgi:hypothetical protein